MVAVRYLVDDLDRAIAFYTQHLDFKLEYRAGSAFASLSRGELVLWLSGPGSSGARAMPNGVPQVPGGWNRIVVQVPDILHSVSAMREAGLRFRNDIESGPGGKQIQLEDPDGNPIELFQAAQR